MTRTHMQPLEREAMHRLDLVRSGEPIDRDVVNACLRITGDLLNLREFDDDGEPVFTLERRNVQ